MTARMVIVGVPSSAMNKVPPARTRKVVPITEAAARLRKKRTKESWAGAMEVVPEGPDTPDHFIMLGNMALIDGNFKDATEAYSRALEITPDAVNARVGRGRARAALGEHARALADFDVAVRGGKVAAHHLLRAASLAAVGRVEDAAKATSRALRLEPENAQAYYLRAVFSSHADEDDSKVKGDLDRAVDLAPAVALYRRERAKRLMGMDEYDAALADLDSALSLSPDDPGLLYLHGECLKERAGEAPPGRLVVVDSRSFDEDLMRACEAALVSLEKALELAPQEGELFEAIVYSIVQARECLPDELAYLAALDRGVEVTPDQCVYLSVREKVRRRRGDTVGADEDRARMKELGIDL